MVVFIFAAIILISYGGVEIFRRWSLQRNFFDIPNERSSHTIPTVRGGGLIIVIICLSVYFFYTLFIKGEFQTSYLISAVLIAFISLLDDLYSISFVWRFLIHSVSAIITISILGYFQEVYIPFVGQINLGLYGAGLTFLWIVWLTNAYNFMDGIDGIAGMQAVTTGIGWLLVGHLLSFPVSGFYGGIVAFACLGFLIQNWQPAKIFMGDVGSAFLGFTFAVMPLLALKEAGQFSKFSVYLPIIGILLVWLFVFDTIFTFIRRVSKGEKVWEAHRTHLYQKLVIAGYSHQLVTSLYGLVSSLTVCLIVLWLIKNLK